MAGLVGGLVQALAAEVSGEIVLSHAHVGVELCLEGDASFIERKLADLIKRADSRKRHPEEPLSVTIGIMDAGLDCLSECRSRQQLGEGHYAFLEVCSAGPQGRLESARTKFYPLITLKGFKGCCRASPGIRGLPEASQGLIHLISSDRGEGAVLRMLIPTKSGHEREGVACAI